MKQLFVGLFAISYLTLVNWQPDFTTAQTISRRENKPLLLNFSGSDWCIPCIRLRKDVFDSKEFQEMADKKLVLYNADFPRSSKNLPPKQIRVDNDALAAKYNPEGKFPFTVLLDTAGHVIKSWDGFPKESKIEFIKSLTQLSDDSSK